MQVGEFRLERPELQLAMARFLLRMTQLINQLPGTQLPVGCWHSLACRTQTISLFSTTMSH